MGRWEKHDREAVQYVLRHYLLPKETPIQS